MKDTELVRCNGLQENAAAFDVQLSSQEKAYLEEIFNPERVNALSKMALLLY